MPKTLDRESTRVTTWWWSQYELLHRLECPSTRMDPTIKNLAVRTLRQHPDLRAYLTAIGVLPLHVLGYEALAEGRYGMVRLAALFPVNPFKGGLPKVFALDGDRRSLHRNPPWDNDEPGVSADLCLFFKDDPDERRWTAEYGLLELFDLARWHLECEHTWRKTNVWPTEDAPHGSAATPVEPRPELKMTPLRVLERHGR